MSIFEGKQRHRFRWLRHLNGMHEILFTGDFNGRNGQLRLFVIFFKRLQWRRQFGNGGGHWSLRPNGSIVLIYPISVVDIGTVNLDWNSGGNNPRQGRSDTSLSLSKAFFSVFFFNSQPLSSRDWYISSFGYSSYRWLFIESRYGGTS